MAQIDDLPPLRDIIKRDGLNAKKSLGQNFLLDLNLTARIARSAGDLRNKTVIEIGPGPGGLTRALLAEGAGHVIAVERDSRCRPALDEIATRYPNRLTIIEADALTVDWRALTTEPAAIVANLPYNIATPLLVGWLQANPWPPWWASATLMFQKEVAERITADPKSKQYGRLAVLTSWRAQAKLLFDLPARAFTPPPKVTSSVVHITPRADAAAVSSRALERVTAAAFGQRRKMLRSSLKTLGVDTDALIGAARLDPTSRAEQNPVENFIALARAFEEHL